MTEERAALISVCVPDNELTLLRMKCLISIKRTPDMIPDSKGEMNQEATGEEEGRRGVGAEGSRERKRERESVVSRTEERPSRAARKAPMTALRKYSLGTTALRGCFLRTNVKIRTVSGLLMASVISIKAGGGSLVYLV